MVEFRLRGAGPMNPVGIFRRTLLGGVGALVTPSLCRAQGTNTPSKKLMRKAGTRPE